MDLLHLIMTSNKLVVGSKNKLGPFVTRDESKSNLKVPIETKHPHFFIFQILS
jgi:hypothetical protein